MYIFFKSTRQHVLTVYNPGGKEISLTTGKTVHVDRFARLRCQGDKKGEPHPMYLFTNLLPPLNPETPYTITGYVNWQEKRYLLAVACIVDEITGEIIFGAPTPGM